MKNCIIVVAAVVINIVWWVWDKSQETGTKVEEWADARDNTNSRAFIRALVTFIAVSILCGGPLTLAH